jgi:hypothetical protein
MDHNADDLEVLRGHRAAGIMKSSTNRMQKAKFVDIVDLPLAPTEFAIMASIDEKGQIPDLNPAAADIAHSARGIQPTNPRPIL